MPVNSQTITIRMPTEREYEQHNPEIKVDSPPANRLRFLNTVAPVWQYPLAWLTPTGCVVCTTGRYVVTALALYGLYNLAYIIFHTIF